MDRIVDRLYRRAVRDALKLSIRAMLEMSGGQEPEEDEPKGLQEIRRLERLAELYRAGLLEIATLERGGVDEDGAQAVDIADSYLQDAERKFGVTSKQQIRKHTHPDE